MALVRKPDSVDVVIVGVGASGATAAKVLSEAGLSVVGLERGPLMRPREHFSGDELKFLNRNYLWPDPKLNPRTVRLDEGSRAEREAFSMCAQLVGGGTVHWAGWFPRPRESDFLMQSLHGDIEGASLADWPIRYEHLEPYFTRVEWEFGCSGIAGADKYEPFRSKGYPSPPTPPTHFGKRFYETCKALGINAFPIPQAMVTVPHKGRDTWNWTCFWNGYGDPSTTRSSTLTTFVPEALATGNFDLRPDCYVREVQVSKDGRAKGVIYIDGDDQEVEQDAAVVILCLGAIESARLMLLSQSPSFPDGIANSSGQLGKNATFHEYLFAVGLFDEPMYGWTGNYINGGSFEFYETDKSRGHIGGSLISASHICHPINWMLPGRPRWGSAAKDADRDFFNYAMKVGLILHDLPVESNRVELDPEVKDAWGLPVAQITHRSHPNDVHLARWQVDKNIEILEAAGARQTIPVHLERGRSTGNTCHQHGTARMGGDRSRTVLNEWCQAHDVENLFVLDGSCFPTATGVNPTLTIMANAWRCSEYIAEVFAKGRREQLSQARLRPRSTDSTKENMTSMSEWPIIEAPANWDSKDRLFFSEHDWHTIEAATARLMPTDHDPGAREAAVVRFIDRYLSGIDYVYASADGSGFLQMTGKHADAWRTRMAAMQDTYRHGIQRLDELARERYGAEFRRLTEGRQDHILELLSGFPKSGSLQPTARSITPHDRDRASGQTEGLEPTGYGTVQIWMFDDGLGFFDALSTHTRQGFYSDPIYGGNAGHVGWRVIGFPGPRSLKDTMDGAYALREYFVQDYDWEDLIPHLKDATRP